MFYVAKIAELWYYYGVMASVFDKLKSYVGLTDSERFATLNRVPQRAPLRRELIAHALLPALLVVSGMFPTAALFAMPIIMCLLYLSYRRFGGYLPTACVIGYGIVSLCLNYDILTVVYFCALLCGFFGIVLACNMSAYLASVATVAVITVVGAVSGVAAIMVAEHKGSGEIAAEYVISHGDDAVISFFAREYYDASDVAVNEIKLYPGDAGYAEAAVTAFSEWASDEFNYYIWYYCIHYGGVFAAVAFFFASIVNRKTSSARDFGVTEEDLRKSTRAIGGTCGKPIAIGEMQLPRVFLLSCVLPAFIASFVLYAVGGYSFITSTVTHTFISLPAAFGCFTLLAFFAGLFKGAARIVATIALVMIGIAAVLFPIVLFVLAVLGVCDSIIDLRYWTRYIMDA